MAQNVPKRHSAASARGTDFAPFLVMGLVGTLLIT
jgi:hypothetical protein